MKVADSGEGKASVFFTERRGRRECRASRTVAGKRFVALADRGLRSDALMIADALRKLELKIEAHVPNAEHLTLLDYLERYLAEKVASGEIKVSSRTSYASYVKGHLAPYPLARRQLARVTREDVEAHFAALVAAGATSGNRKDLYRLLHAAFTRAIEDRLLRASPLVGVRAPKHRSQARQGFPYDVVAAVFRALEGHPLEAFFWIAITRAYRVSEIMALRWSDFDLTDGTLLVTKQLSADGSLKAEDSNRGFDQHPKVLELLAARKIGKRPSDFIFPNSAGSRFAALGIGAASGSLQPANFRNRVWYPLLASAGLPKMEFHRFRNTALATMYEATDHDLLAVKDLAGHASMAQTLRYLGRTRRLERSKTAAADALFDKRLARGRADLELRERREARGV